MSGWLLSVILKGSGFAIGRFGGLLIRGGIILAVVGAIYMTGRLHEARSSNAFWQEKIADANEAHRREVEGALEAGRDVAAAPEDAGELVNLCKGDPNCRRAK